MDLALKGKRALVTGSTTGIGEAIIRRLAAEGARVIVHGRNAGQAYPLLNALRAEGADAAFAFGDLNTDAEADNVVSQALEAFEGVDILVNNAGRFSGKPWVDTEPAEWNSMYNNNVTSMVRVSRRLAPLMAERRWGRIVNMASTIGLMPDVWRLMAGQLNLRNLSSRQSAHGLPIQWDAWAASKKLPVWWPSLQAPLRITSTEAICGSMAASIRRSARRESGNGKPIKAGATLESRMGCVKYVLQSYRNP